MEEGNMKGSLYQITDHPALVAKIPSARLEHERS